MNHEIKTEQFNSIKVIEDCTPILIEAYNGEPWYDKWNRETALATLSHCHNSPGFIGWMASSNNEIIGGGVGNIDPYYTGNNFYLKHMFVAVKFQKMGIGKLLVNEIKKDLEKVGITTITLFTGAKIYNFYHKIGFEKIDEISMMIYTK